MTRSAKDPENINARPSRLNTRAKSALAAGGASCATAAVAATAPVNTRVTASTAVSKAKSMASTTTEAGAKRKREALVEVTGLVTNHKGKGTTVSGGLKRKEKEAAGITSATTKNTQAVVKPTVKTGGVRSNAGALRRVLRSTSESTTTSNSKTDVEGTAFEQDEKMEVDDPLDVPPPPPVASSVISKPLPTAVAEEEELGRVFKKRHTGEELTTKELDFLDQSQAEVDIVAAELVEVVPPSTQLWEDLDAEDWDDPVMVSEYVVDVCVYLKQIEVCFLQFICRRLILTRLPVGDASKPRLYGQARRNQLGTSRYTD